MENFANWLKEKRNTFSLTQTQLASKLGINQGHISGLETGRLKPDKELINKAEKIFNEIGMMPSENKKMPNKALEALKAYRENKDGSFNLELYDGVFITADRNQYILHQGANLSYFVDIKSLLKYFIASKARQSAITSVKEIIDKLDEIYANIDKKFANYNPAKI